MTTPENIQDALTDIEIQHVHDTIALGVLKRAQAEGWYADEVPWDAACEKRFSRLFADGVTEYLKQCTDARFHERVLDRALQAVVQNIIEDAQRIGERNS